MKGSSGGGDAEVPAADSSDNSTSADVAGNKNDTITSSKSLIAKLAFINEYYRGTRQPYPAAAAGVSVTSSSGSWGSFTEIIPASTISNPFIITRVMVHNATNTSAYVLTLDFAYGAGDTAAFQVRRWVPVAAAQERDQIMLPSCPIIPADSRVRARAERSTGASGVINVKVEYIEFS